MIIPRRKLAWPCRRIMPKRNPIRRDSPFPWRLVSAVQVMENPLEILDRGLVRLPGRLPALKFKRFLGDGRRSDLNRDDGLVHATFLSLNKGVN